MIKHLRVENEFVEYFRRRRKDPKNRIILNAKFLLALYEIFQCRYLISIIE
eukprot:XP_001708378.1 Hypothetical protein GL50803_36613 [Giardia lamblia ATCC 50803]